VQNGVKRWYRRLSPVEFDQEDVRHEADAFADFLRGVASEQKIDLSNAVFLGYSNGANLIAALSQLHPGLVRNAVLLRSMPVLAGAAQPDLSNARHAEEAEVMRRAVEHMRETHGETIIRETMVEAIRSRITNQRDAA
jgi:predicted esterase